MIEIKASTKVTGTRRIASIEAAKRKVRDGSLYLIRRHGAYFRPHAHGYTTSLAAAGVYSASEARGYLDVEGLSVVPMKSIIKQIEAEIVEAEAAAISLHYLRSTFVGYMETGL